ncbi:MAG TPA: hypothetical protein EYQ64_00205 [Gemmatimonadetes bacterium]|nr:hypothetical protein [Gemmatimonadota bacterium]
MEDSDLNESGGEGPSGALAEKTESTALEHVGRSALDHPNLLGVGDPPFSRLALGFGVGFSVLVVAWTILRTISEGFGWPYYGWPY